MKKLVVMGLAMAIDSGYGKWCMYSAGTGRLMEKD